MTSGVGALLGLAVGLGLVTIASSSPPWRRLSLAQRLAPYLVSVSGGAERSRLVPLASGGGRRSHVRSLARLIDRWSGGSSSVTRRLERLGGPLTLEQFRVEQVIWGLAGAVLAIGVLALRTAVSGYPGSALVVVLTALGATAGAAGRDRWLSQQVVRRESRIRSALPTIAELLALSVAAGEGTAAALERVGRVAHGDLAHEFARTFEETRAGAGLTDALSDLARRVDLPELTRFVDGVVVAIDRGTPLSGVLQAQAADARDAERRELIELGGRKDILMMIPVVFLVLPLSVLFALFPGFYGISLSAP